MVRRVIVAGLEIVETCFEIVIVPTLAQPPKTKEPYGCGIPLAGACPTVCQLQAVSVDRVGGGLCREKRDVNLLSYVGTVNT